MRRAGIGVVGVAVLGLPGWAAAQECVTAAPDLYPADGAPGVPINGVVRIVFHQPYDLELPLEEVLRLVVEDNGRPVPGVVTLTENGTDTLVELRTDELLESETRYRAVAVLPEGAGEQEFGFRTGPGTVDEREPEFAGPTEIRVVPADNVTCHDPESEGPPPAGEDDEDEDDRGYRVTISFRPADDVAGAANIDYLLIQTQGPDLEEPVFRKRVRAAGSGELFGAVFLPEDAVGRQEVCFQVHAEDMFGNLTAPSREACGDPIGPGYFRSMCTVAGPGSPVGGVPLAGALVLGAALFSATRRRRARPRPRPRRRP